MKRIGMLCLLMAIGFVFAVSAEDLGELAKKEKARREAIAKTGKKAKTLTNADVANIKSDLAIKQTTPPPGETAEATEESTEETSTTTAESPSASVDRQIEELKKEKEQKEQEAQQARETVGEGGLFHTRNIGTQYQTAREAEKKAAEIQEKIEKKEPEKKDPE